MFHKLAGLESKKPYPKANFNMTKATTALIVAALFAVSSAFSPNVMSTMTPVRRTAFLSAKSITSLQMSETPEEPKKDGNVFDDEVILRSLLFSSFYRAKKFLTCQILIYKNFHHRLA